MLKVRLMGTKNDIKWFGKILQRHPKIEVTEFSDFLEKCRYTYQGNETSVFLMSDKYIMALYTHCLVARKEVALQGIYIYRALQRKSIEW